MKTFWKVLGWTGARSAAGRCLLGVSDRLRQALHDQRTRQSPGGAVSAGQSRAVHPSGTRRRHLARLALGQTDNRWGVKKRDDDYATTERFIREVQAFDRGSLDPQDRLTYDILLDQYQTVLSFKRFDWLSSEGLYPIAPTWGYARAAPDLPGDAARHKERKDCA